MDGIQLGDSAVWLLSGGPRSGWPGRFQRLKNRSQSSGDVAGFAFHVSELDEEAGLFESQLTLGFGFRFFAGRLAA